MIASTAFASDSEGDGPSVCTKMSAIRTRSLALVSTRGKVVFRDTPLGESSLITFRIRNGGSAPISFEWRNVATENEERVALDACDRWSAEGRRRARDCVQFSSPVIKIDPLAGRVGPRGECSVPATFTPTVAGRFECCAYLLVLGVDERVCVPFSGIAVGPELSVTPAVLNMGTLHLGASSQRVFAVTNTGALGMEWRARKTVDVMVKPERSEERRVGKECIR
jgi:hypothetical protein